MTYDGFMIEAIVSKLNEISSSLNSNNHPLALRLLNEFDKEYMNRSMPIELIFRRIYMSAELSLRLGKPDKSLHEISTWIDIFNCEPNLKFKLLLKAGRLESLTNRHGISPKYYTEALGLAESLEDMSLIAKAYSAISHMFAIRYPGLAIYFLRKAEIYFSELGELKSFSLCRMERALICYAITKTRDISDEEMKCLLDESRHIVSAFDTNGLNCHEIRYCRYIKAFVLSNEQELYELITELKDIEALPDKCRYEEIYIGICIEKGLWDEAHMMLAQYTKDAMAYHAEVPELKAKLAELSRIINCKAQTIYIPFYLQKSAADPMTMFDILDHYSLEDEFWALNNDSIRCLFPSYAQEDKFEAIKMPNGICKLFPLGLAFNVYYRGQSKYYEKAFASIFRDDMTPAKQFVERIRYEELSHCIDDYPKSQFFQNDFYLIYPDKTTEPIKFSVDKLALAQHYGIRTELMDLTTDKFVAAFFATTICKDGVYYPITENTDEKGVFYRYSERIPNHVSLSAVGLQPFSRPGEQKGLVYRMEQGQNFNDIVISKDFFEQNADVSQFIFNYTNRSKKLFPEDPLTKHAEQIVESKILSTDAYLKAKEEFYADTPDDTLMGYLDTENIKLTDNINFSFTAEEKAKCQRDWSENECQRVSDKIITRLCYKGPIEMDA
jgi:hypothetical protein